MKNNTTEVIILFLYSFMYYMPFSSLGKIEERDALRVDTYSMLVYSLSMYWVISVQAHSRLEVTGEQGSIK